MKNIVSIIALVAVTASGANATVITATGDLDPPKWNGKLSLTAIPDHCEFVGNTLNGSMNYNIDTGVWTTTADATVTVQHRGASQLRVHNTGLLQRTDIADPDMAVTVDYTGSTISGDGVLSLADTAEISVGSLTVSSAKKETVINIGGTATMADTDVETNGIENGGQYQIVHTVTCIQK